MRALVAGLVVIAISCGGNQPPGTPAGAVDHTLTMAKDGQGARAARMLAKPLRGRAIAENQLAALGDWIWLRSAQQLGLRASTLVKWDPPQIERQSGGTATVKTTLRFVRLDDGDCPLPVVVDLVVEDGHWRIAAARISPTPPWFADVINEAKLYGGDPPVLVDLATVADSFRPPPVR